MRFNVEKRSMHDYSRYNKDDLDIAYSFTKKIYREFGTFLKAVVLFGSTSRQKPGEGRKTGDIDLLVIVDDTSMLITPEISEAYRIITEKLIAETSMRVHVITLRLSSFWEYIRMGDPVGVNILRDGMALIDTGFFDPLQMLLRQGRIRPTREAVYTYFAKAPRTLNNSKWHLLQAVIDLYWAVIDSAHAALMKMGEIPPSPEHVADLMEEALVKKKLLPKKYPMVMRRFYQIAKMIMHSEVTEISGEEFDKYYIEAKDFVEEMKKFLDK